MKKTKSVKYQMHPFKEEQATKLLIFQGHCCLSESFYALRCYLLEKQEIGLVLKTSEIKLTGKAPRSIWQPIYDLNCKDLFSEVFQFLSFQNSTLAFASTRQCKMYVINGIKESTITQAQIQNFGEKIMDLQIFLLKQRKLNKYKLGDFYSAIKKISKLAEKKIVNTIMAQRNPRLKEQKIKVCKYEQIKSLMQEIVGFMTEKIHYRQIYQVQSLNSIASDYYQSMEVLLPSLKSNEVSPNRIIKSYRSAKRIYTEIKGLKRRITRTNNIISQPLIDTKVKSKTSNSLNKTIVPSIIINTQQQTIPVPNQQQNLSSETKVKPAEVIVKPAEAIVKPTELKGKPSELKFKPTVAKVKPDKLKIQSTELKAKSTEVIVKPVEAIMKQSPAELLLVKPSPSKVIEKPDEQVKPSLAIINPSDGKGKSPEMLVKPVDNHKKSKNLPFQYKLKKPSTRKQLTSKPMPKQQKKYVPQNQNANEIAQIGSVYDSQLQISHYVSQTGLTTEGQHARTQVFTAKDNYCKQDYVQSQLSLIKNTITITKGIQAPQLCRDMPADNAVVILGQPEQSLANTDFVQKNSYLKPTIKDQPTKRAKQLFIDEVSNNAVIAKQQHYKVSFNRNVNKNALIMPKPRLELPKNPQQTKIDTHQRRDPNILPRIQTLMDQIKIDQLPVNVIIRSKTKKEAPTLEAIPNNVDPSTDIPTNTIKVVQSSLQQPTPFVQKKQQRISKNNRHVPKMHTPKEIVIDQYICRTNRFTMPLVPKRRVTIDPVATNRSGGFRTPLLETKWLYSTTRWRTGQNCQMQENAAVD